MDHDTGVLDGSGLAFGSVAVETVDHIEMTSVPNSSMARSICTLEIAYRARRPSECHSGQTTGQLN